MTDPRPEPAHPASAAPALRWFTPGVIGAAVVATAVAVLGQQVGLIPADVGAAVWLGYGCALLAVVLGSLAYAKVGAKSSAERDPHLASTRLQGLLGAAFVVKVAVFGAGFAALSLSDVKFEFLVAFALAFAGAALVLQLVTVVQLARSFASRPRATPVQSR